MENSLFHKGMVIVVDKKPSLEQFQDQLKIQLILSLVGALLILFLFFLLFWLNYSIRDHGYRSFFSGFQAGICGTFFVASISYVIKILRVRKNEQKLKKMYIEAYDERKREISLRASSLSSFLTIYLLMVGVMVAGFWDQKVFFTLLAVLLVYAVILLISELVYSKKL